MSPENTRQGELNLEKEFGKRAGGGREGREKWDERKEAVPRRFLAPLFDHL